MPAAKTSGRRAWRHGNAALPAGWRPRGTGEAQPRGKHKVLPARVVGESCRMRAGWRRLVSLLLEVLPFVLQSLGSTLFLVRLEFSLLGFDLALHAPPAPHAQPIRHMPSALRLRRDAPTSFTTRGWYPGSVQPRLPVYLALAVAQTASLLSTHTAAGEGGGT